MNNLINNAIKFTYQGGVIIQLDLVLVDSKSWAVIKVIDTGIGIQKQALGIIFDEFRQASEGLNRAFEGTGLGLTITKKSVELMDGKISVESFEGKGSTFNVCFPESNSN